MIGYFVSFEHPAARLSEADRAAVTRLVAATPGLVRGLMHSAADSPLGDGSPPAMVLELSFADLPALEAAIDTDGHLQSLVAPSLEGASITHQAMWLRPFPVPSCKRDAAEATTFLVHYPGQAENLNAWLRHYQAHHLPLMAQLPSIRELAMATRLDWCDAMPWARDHHMQRNKVVFDDLAGLAAALASPLRAQMRADFHQFPPFSGGARHVPMRTTTILGPLFAP